MKKALLLLIILLSAPAAFADGEGSIRINIQDPVKTNKYFFCVYNVGCLSIKASDNGKTYPMPAMDLGNILQFVVTDVETMKEYMVPSNQSCNINVHENQKVTITGKMVVHYNQPQVENLRCHVA